jgi:hypothetical protein
MMANKPGSPTSFIPTLFPPTNIKTNK